MQKILLLLLITISLAAHAQNDKSFKLEFYNSEESKDYANVTAADKPLLETSSFVCELVNVYDPDTRYEISSFDFTIKAKGVEQKYTGVSEATLLERIKQTASLPDGSMAAKITITKVFYFDSKKAQASMSNENYGYAEIEVY